ncbi:MAG: site-specific integrase [Rhodocyclaceae bacterium]|nr:MAG: site-specific integrase [Rhodocyclaceae bacterium]
MGKKSTHKPGKLAAVSLKTLGEGWHSDGGNLYLFVRGDSRAWVFRFVAPDGKRRNMGLGSQYSVALAEARKQAAILREQVKHPTAPNDPLAARQEARLAQKLARRKHMTFKACAEAYIEAHRAEWKNSKHVQQWENTLTTYAYPVFGDLPVSVLDDALVLKVLMPIWESKTSTAARLRGRIEQVLDWATFSKFRQGENPARWKGHLDNSLAKPNKVAKVKHHAALPYAEMGPFMVALRSREGLGAKALEYAILTAARSGEVRGAKWDEIDLPNRLWVIPAERMKMEKEHRVPLSDVACDLLKALARVEDEVLVFPSAKPKRPMSDMTLTAVLRRMGRGDLTAHGFRSTFRDWAAEATNYPSDMAEMALAHSIGDKVEAAYRRGDMLKKRFRMMNEWAKYCGTVRKADAKVVPIRGAA